MKADNDIFIIDFDSTFTQVEAMEELAAISLKNDPERDILIEQIKELTNLAMDGKMPFDKSLTARIALLSAKKYHIKMLVNRLRQKITPSFAANRKFFKAHYKQIYIVSGGFKEFIFPIVKPFGILENQVYGNTFTFDSKNNIIGADAKNPLSQDKGKVKLLKQLKLKGNIHVIGDGYTDYEIKEAKLAKYFYAFTENIARDAVVKKAQIVAPSLDEILFKLKLPMAISYPKSRLKVLLWGDETLLAQNELKKEGYQVSFLPTNASAAAVKKQLVQTKILLFEPNQNLLKLEDKLLNNLSIAAIWGENNNQELNQIFNQKGIPIFEPNYAHTRSVAELALLYLLRLSRLQNHELIGRKLSIIGYGHSGSLLSVFAEQLGMEVYYYDTFNRPPIGNAKKLNNLNDVVKKADFLVLLAGRSFGEHPIINTKELRQLPINSCFINLSYDESVNTKAVLSAIKDKKLFAYATDCLKPETYNILQKQQKVIADLNQRTATEHTKNNIAHILTEHIIKYINNGSTKGSINFPNITLPELVNSHRFIHIHHNKSGVLASINSILANHKINITGQYLKTNQQIGYVITDVSKTYSDKVIAELKAIENTIKFRVLY